jgi:hypothetical protein
MKPCRAPLLSRYCGGALKCSLKVRTTVTETKVRKRTSHPELAKPEFARVYWHHGRYHFRSAKDRPAIVLGNDIDSACFLAKLAIAKQADKAWRAYIQRKVSDIAA